MLERPTELPQYSPSGSIPGGETGSIASGALDVGTAQRLCMMGRHGLHNRPPLREPNR